MANTFDPHNIKQSEMNKLADAIEEYLDVLEKVIIIPEEMKKDCEEKIKEGIKRTEKLIKKLRKGDTSVFKDEDEWNPIN